MSESRPGLAELLDGHDSLRVLEAGEIAGVLTNEGGPDHPPKDLGVPGLGELGHHVHGGRPERLPELLTHPAR